MPGRAAAFTLIELLITLSILSLLSLYSIPDIHLLLQNKAGDASIQQLTRLLNYARHSAVTKGIPVTVCRSLDGLACGGSWNDGVLIFSDSNTDHQVNQQDEVLRYSELKHGEGYVVLRSFPNRQYVQFLPMGFTRKQNGNFTWCPQSSNPAQAQQLIFSQTGRVRLAKDSNGDGIKEGADGRSLRC